MSVLDISGDMYADMTGTETAARLKGAADRKIDSLRETRILATLLRNAHFKGSVTEREYMPLPGDEVTPEQSAKTTFMALAAAMGVEPTIEEINPADYES
jgi:hypothetical protein